MGANRFEVRKFEVRKFEVRGSKFRYARRFEGSRFESSAFETSSFNAAESMRGAGSKLDPQALITARVLHVLGHELSRIAFAFLFARSVPRYRIRPAIAASALQESAHTSLKSTSDQYFRRLPSNRRF